MNFIAKHSLRLFFLALGFAAFAAVPAYGQGAKLRIDNLDKLEQKADETVDVTIDGTLLDTVVKLLSHDKDPDAAKVREFIAGIKGIYVKSFEFDTEGAYSPADVDALDP